MFNFFLQRMHVTHAYIIKVLASAKAGDTGILYCTCICTTYKIWKY